MAEEKTVQKENPMGTRPINSLLISMSLPIMISMIVQALYNIVDSMFVARVSENALTAVSLAFPVQNLMISVATGTGVGINALLSRSLGEKNFDRANRTAKNGIFLLVVSAIVSQLSACISHMFFAVPDERRGDRGGRYGIYPDLYDLEHRPVHADHDGTIVARRPARAFIPWLRS